MSRTRFQQQESQPACTDCSLAACAHVKITADICVSRGKQQKKKSISQTAEGCHGRLQLIDIEDVTAKWKIAVAKWPRNVAMLQQLSSIVENLATNFIQSQLLFKEKILKEKNKNKQTKSRCC